MKSCPWVGQSATRLRVCISTDRTHRIVSDRRFALTHSAPGSPEVAGLQIVADPAFRPTRLQMTFEA